MSDDYKNDWNEWKRLVLSTIEQLNSDLKQVKADIGSNKIEVGKLKVWSAIFGAAGGSLTLLFLKGVIDKLW